MFRQSSRLQGARDRRSILPKKGPKGQFNIIRYQGEATEDHSERLRHANQNEEGWKGGRRAGGMDTARDRKEEEGRGRRKEGEGERTTKKPANPKCWWNSRAAHVSCTTTGSVNWGGHSGKQFSFIYQSLRYVHHLTETILVIVRNVCTCVSGMHAEMFLKCCLK